MMGCFQRTELRLPNAMRIWGSSLVMLGVLSACSSVPDAVNPVEWYKGTRDFVTGKDEPEPVAADSKGEAARTQRSVEANAKAAKAGLVADRGNAQYAEPIRREVTPTRQLARHTPAAEPVPAPAVAPAPAPAPAPAIAASPLPQAAPASPPPKQATDTPEGPVAMNMTPPPPADVPETVAVPGRPRRLQQQFEKRLAESAQTTVQPGMIDMAPTGRTVHGEDAPIHLVPPGTNKKPKLADRAGGGKGLAAPQPEPQPAASFEVASVRFDQGTALSRLDKAALDDVARLYKQTKGVVRVIGYAPSPSFGGYDAVRQAMGGLDASQERAEAVARELTRRGVPARKIMIAANPSYAIDGLGGAQVFLDVM